MRLLSSAVPLHADVDDLAGERYGQIDDIEKFLNDVISKYLGPKGGYLRPDVREELLGQLFIVAVRCSETYEPGRGWGFRTYVFRTTWNRITDWYRKQGGDRRYTPRPPQESLDGTHEEIGDVLGEAAALDSIEAIDTTGLTPESVMTLRKIVQPMLELGLTKEELGEAYGWPRRDLNLKLAALRKELELRDPTLAARKERNKRHQQKRQQRNREAAAA